MLRNRAPACFYISLLTERVKLLCRATLGMSRQACEQSGRGTTPMSRHGGVLTSCAAWDIALTRQTFTSIVHRTRDDWLLDNPAYI